MEWSIKSYNFEFLFLQIQSCSKFLNLYFVFDVNAFSEKQKNQKFKFQFHLSSDTYGTVWVGIPKNNFFIACIGFEMKFLGRLGIICHVAYYYRGNVYTTSCKKKSNQRRKREEKLSYFARKMLCFKEIYQELEEK